MQTYLALDINKKPITSALLVVDFKVKLVNPDDSLYEFPPIYKIDIERVTVEEINGYVIQPDPDKLKRITSLVDNLGELLETKCLEEIDRYSTEQMKVLYVL